MRHGIHIRYGIDRQGAVQTLNVTCKSLSQ